MSTTGSASTRPFLKRYASYYDILYRDKDYLKEVEYVEWVFRKFGSGKIGSVIDIGCGTGGHALPLAKRGHYVVGIDRSPWMLRRARSKAASQLKRRVTFRIATARSFRLARKFDAACCLFAVMDYLVDDTEIVESLANIRRHLARGALFLFDYWNAPAVLAIRPAIRFVVKRGDHYDVARTAIPVLDLAMRMNTTKYYCTVLRNGKIVDEFTEVHQVRFFFRKELDTFLRNTGFLPIAHLAFLKRRQAPGRRTWNALCVARAV